MLAFDNIFRDRTKLFGRDSVHIEPTYRCNIACSYCTVHAGPQHERSVLEASRDRVVRLLEETPPAIISVTGGEPLLWKELGSLIEQLPQHYWIIFSNLSGVASWMFHPHVKLIIASYHHGQVEPKRFVGNVLRLKEGGARPFAKFIARPGEDFVDEPLWQRFIDEGIPGAFAPFEALNVRYSTEWMHAICTTHLTSALYSARFFRRGTKLRPCLAGTKRAFHIDKDGKIGRCSQVSRLVTFDQRGPISERQGYLDAPNFFDKPQPCLPAHGCYCEPQHFGLMTAAGENRRWERYIMTGMWDRPAVGELRNFVRAECWDSDALRRALAEPGRIAPNSSKLRVSEPV